MGADKQKLLKAVEALRKVTEEAKKTKEQIEKERSLREQGLKG